jgi:L-iditol 2-dehydrogenase
MKKVVLAELRKFSIIDAEKPKILSESDVLIKIASVGICGSDVHYFKTGRIGNQIVQFPFTLGHECSGFVEEVGAKVSQLATGDRIAIDPAISCGTCDQCKLGRRHTCRNLKFLGNPLELEGALQEYIVLPEMCCFKLPETVSLEDGLTIEPLTIAMHAVHFNQGNQNIAILGFGPIGFCTYQALKYQHVNSNIIVTDKIDDRVSISIKKGAGWAANPLKRDIVKEILAKYPQGLDTVFECCGQQEAINQAIHLLKPGGQLIVIGIPEEDMIEYDAHTMRRKELSVQNVRRQNEKVEEAIQLLGNGQIKMDGFITHKFSINNIQEGFELAENYGDSIMKAIVNFD